LLQLTEESLESVKNKDEINTLEQAQKILSSPKTKFTRSELETLQKAFSIIIKENKVIQSSNSEESKANKSQIPSEGLIKPSKFTEKDPTIMLQRKLPSNGSQRTNQIVNSDIRELLSTIQESSKNTENKNEFNKSANGIDGKELLNQAQETGAPTKIQFTEEDKRELLIQAQKILSSPKTEFTKAELETLQKALSIIIKEIKDSQPINNELPSEGLIKHSKFTEKDPTILSQNSLDSKASQEADQIVNPDIQKLLQLIEESSKNTENKDEINLEEAQKILISSKPELTKEDKRELLIQAQKILSSPKTEFTKAELETLQKALSIIIKENKVIQSSDSEESKANKSQIPSEGLIKHSNSIEETSPTLSQKNLHLKDSQEANQIVNSDIQKLLSTIQESSKSIESKNEINTLEQAQKILSSPKTEFTKAELETLQKAFSIIIKENKVIQSSDSEESKANKSQIPSEGLIKHSNSIEESPNTMLQNNLDSKGSQETTQIVNPDIQKLLQLIEENSKSIENKDEINTLELSQTILNSSKTQPINGDKKELLIEAQKILSSSKTTFTPEELNIIKTALGITTNNNPKAGKPSSNTIGETTFIANSLIKGNIDKTKNNKTENNNSIKSKQFDQKAEISNTKNNLGKNVYFDPYETRKSNINKDKNSDLQKDNTVKLTPPSNLEDTSKNLNIEQLKTTQSTNEIDLKSLQINKNNIQDSIPATNLKDLNAQIKEVIISKNTQTFLNESFSVKISPPELGKVDIQILKNGQAVTVNISTETENAKNIISKTLQSLVGNLRDEGYQPISIKVNVTQEEHYLADQNQQHQQEQEQKKYHEEDHNGDQSEEGTYYTFDEYLRSDLNA